MRVDCSQVTMQEKKKGDDVTCAVTVHVDPGACMFKSRITGRPNGKTVLLEIESGCPCVQELAESLNSVDAFESLKMPYEENPIFRKSGTLLRHATCPIPIAILKCIEASIGLALKKNVKIEYEK